MQIQAYKFHYLLHAAHLLEERLRARLMPLGVQPRQARVLDALERMGAASQVDLADAFGLTAASMSTMTSRLQKAGLITRRRDRSERRSNVLKLTDKGQDLLKAIYEAWRETDGDVADLIGVDKADQLGELTYQLRNALGGRTPGSEPQG